ncbi:MAG: hypothetical protein WBX38_00285 [Candidatus Sulfotelmatobacter sp.]
MTDQNNNSNNDAERNQMRERVERAVEQALDAHIPQLQSQIVGHVLALLPTSADAPISDSDESAGGLASAVANIHAGSNQKEILRALLDAGGGYCSRIALFVVKGGTASGWQSRGFSNDEATKDFALDLNAGPVAHSYQNRVAAHGNIAEMGAQFVDHFGRPANEQVMVLPLALKEKVAALVYADGGETNKLNSSALELLVMATSAWLEVASLRKQAVTKEDGSGHTRHENAPSPVQTVSSFSDPFASHAPKHVPASAPVEMEAIAEVVEQAAAHTSNAAAAGAGAGAAPAAAADPLAAISPEDADIHRKAQRFARLLVDEIKLYNQAKVAEGRRNKDLYDRLKEDIEKSRGTFQKRYGGTAAVSVDYFQQELLRSLAEDDVSIMGSNFRR